MFTVYPNLWDLKGLLWLTNDAVQNRNIVNSIISETDLQDLKREHDRCVKPASVS